MKPVKKQLKQTLQNDPHGDTTALQMNPQEASLVSQILKQLGGAGVQNPKTGLLQYYPRGAEPGGGGDVNGPAGRSGDGIGGGGRGNGSFGGSSAGGMGGQFGGVSSNPGANNAISGHIGPNGIGDRSGDNPGQNAANLTSRFDSFHTQQNSLLGRLLAHIGIGALDPSTTNAVDPNTQTTADWGMHPLKTAAFLAGFAPGPIGLAATAANIGMGLTGYDGPQINFSHMGPGTPSVPGQNQGTQSNGQMAGNGSYGGTLGNVASQTEQAAAPVNASAPTQSAVAHLLQQYMAPKQLNQQIPGLMDYNQWAPGYSYPWYAS